MSEIILSNEQISVARYSENGVIRVNGGPGSGKTLVAVKRAIFLAKDYKYAEKEDKILFLFYNKGQHPVHIGMPESLRYDSFYFM